MFSWLGSKDKIPSVLSTSYDPLKGSPGASAFYRKANSELPVQGREYNVKNSGKGLAAAAFYGASATNDDSKFPGVDEINSFLQESKAKFLDEDSRHLFQVIMGNEASDLDSMASAIVLAFFLSKQAPAGGDICHVPLMNIPRSDFHLRTEAAWLMQSMGLDVSSLLFLDEVDLKKLQEEGELQLYLVDHNRLAGAQEELHKAVVGILDHHKEENQYEWALQRSIHQVGSCSTLVAELISEQAAELLHNRAVCRLLLAAILVDTANLDPSAGRCDARDETMAALLISGAGAQGCPAFFELLKEKKFDQLGLTTQELLRRDYKQFDMGPGMEVKKREVVNVGISSVSLPLSQLVGKDPKFQEEAQAFAKERGLHVLTIMSAYWTPSKKFKRELAFISSYSSLLTGLCYFMQNDMQNLKLKAINVRGLPSGAKAYSQGTVTASRKLIAPLLFTYFAKGS